MQRLDCDILVVGGGIAGLIAAQVCAAQGFDTICIDREDPQATPPDLRSTAFLMPSIRLLQDGGLWQGLDPFAAPLRLMRLIDTDPATGNIRETAEFAATEVGEALWGYNIANAALRDRLRDSLAHPGSARLLAPASFERITPRTSGALVRLSDGRMIAAKLVIAADGRDSPLRDQLGIPARTWRYGQRGVVFSARHDLPHDFTSTEIHASGGPFTFVPTSDPHVSAVVWMDRSAAAADLMRLPDQAFAEAATKRSGGVLGNLALEGSRAIWPIITRLADRFSAPRTVLVAEAAHVVPPIGAQGLNTSLADITLLLELAQTARKSGHDIGGPEVTDAFHRRRWPVVAARMAGIHALNLASLAGSPLLRDLRKAGLAALRDTPGLRRAAMRAGLG